MSGVTWVLKLSKFCNMRCSYCYEWDELHKRDRLSLELWRKILIGIRDYHQKMSREGKFVSRLVFHGGEPLALPQGYLEDLMREKELLLPSKEEFPVSVQTNAYAISANMISLLKNHGIGVGVSYDHVPGVRRSITGQETERKIRSNVEKLRSNGLFVGGIVVVARHTYANLPEIYDFYKAIGMQNMRVLPLFSGPASRDAASYDVDDERIVSALTELFHHWMSDDAQLAIAPLNQYLQTAISTSLQIHPGLWSRRLHGDAVFLVNTDGALYTVAEAYEPGSSMGSLDNLSIGEILESSDYAESLGREEKIQERYCHTCRFAGHCSGWPLLASSLTETQATRAHCPHAFAVTSNIETFLRENDYDANTLRSLVADVEVEARKFDKNDVSIEL